jgi:hypothetical protein
MVQAGHRGSTKVQKVFVTKGLGKKLPADVVKGRIFPLKGSIPFNTNTWRTIPKT